MKHSILINQNNVIEVHVTGDITFDDVSALGQQVVSFMTTLEDIGYLIKLLVDYTEGASIEEPARALARTIACSLELDKIACFGTNEATPKIVAEVSQAADLEKKLRLFQTRAEAEAWLSE